VRRAQIAHRSSAPLQQAEALSVCDAPANPAVLSMLVALVEVAEAVDFVFEGRARALRLCTARVAYDFV
jgi:hypothetical protein